MPLCSIFRRSWLGIALIGLIAAPADGAAAPDRSQRFEDIAHRIDLTVGGSTFLLPLPFALSGGMTWGIPIKPRGFGPDLNDAFYFEFEANVGWNWLADWTFASLSGGFRYQRYLSDRLAPFFALKGGGIVLFRGREGGYIDASGGAVLLLGKRVGLRLTGSTWILFGTDFHVPVFGRLAVGFWVEL